MDETIKNINYCGRFVLDTHNYIPTINSTSKQYTYSFTDTLVVGHRKFIDIDLTEYSNQNVYDQTTLDVITITVAMWNSTNHIPFDLSRVIGVYFDYHNISKSIYFKNGSWQDTTQNKCPSCMSFQFGSFDKGKCYCVKHDVASHGQYCPCCVQPIYVVDIPRLHDKMCSQSFIKTIIDNGKSWTNSIASVVTSTLSVLSSTTSIHKGPDKIKQD